MSEVRLPVADEHAGRAQRSRPCGIGVVDRFVGVAIATIVVLACGRAVAAMPPDAQALLAQVRDAAGAAAWRRVELVHVDGTLAAAGMQAAYHADEDARDGRFDRRSRFPIFARRDVWDGRTRWRQDNSGGVHRLDGVFAMRRNVTDGWIARRGWLAPDAAAAFVGPVAHRTVDGRNLAVVTAIPADGQPVALFFDATTFDLARIERVMPISVQVVTFDDYRMVDGVRLPFTIAVDDHEEDVWTLQVDRYGFDAAPHRATFAPPTGPDDWTLASSSVTVPFDLRNGVLTVAATIDGHGPYRFIFDTGGQSALSAQLAAELGLAVVGAAPGGGVGEALLTERYTRVARVDVGGFRLVDQPFTVIPLSYADLERGKEPPLGGLLGLEVLERVAVRIDYPARTITFTSFASHRFDSAAVVTPVRFDDDIPQVPGRLDGRDGVFTLDTGSSGTLMIQGLWAQRIGVVERMKRGVPIASFGVGGMSRNWASRIGAFEVGGVTLHGLVARTNEDRRGAFSSRTESGNLSTQILANFVVDFDYRQGRMSWLYVPGYVAPPLNRGGLRARKERPEDFRVVQVSDDAPAARAGVRLGDRIVAIDGVASTGLSSADFAETFEGAPGTHVRLDLVRDGAPVVADIVLTEMLPT